MPSSKSVVAACPHTFSYSMFVQRCELHCSFEDNVPANRAGLLSISYIFPNGFALSRLHSCAKKSDDALKPYSSGLESPLQCLVRGFGVLRVFLVVPQPVSNNSQSSSSQVVLHNLHRIVCDALLMAESTRIELHVQRLC